MDLYSFDSRSGLPRVVTTDGQQGGTRSSKVQTRHVLGTGRWGSTGCLVGFTGLSPGRGHGWARTRTPQRGNLDTFVFGHSFSVRLWAPGGGRTDFLWGGRSTEVCPRPENHYYSPGGSVEGNTWVKTYPTPEFPVRYPRGCLLVVDLSRTGGTLPGPGTLPRPCSGGSGATGWFE